MADPVITFEDDREEEQLTGENPVIPLEEVEETAVSTLTYDDDSPNLVPVLMKHPEGKKALRKIADQVRKDFDSAREGSEQYRERFKKDWRLFTGDLPEKTFPFKDSANAHVPILLENITRLHARSYAEIFGDWTNVFGVLPVGPDDNDAAELLSKHGNWQIRVQMPDFKRQMDRALLLFWVAGDMVGHSYYDEVKRRNRHETLTPDEIVIPYVFTSVEPDLSDCPFVAKILNRYRHELERMEGTWYDVRAVIEKRTPSWDDDPDQPMREDVGEEQGIIPGEEDDRAPYRLVHYEGWLSLPEQKNQRFCKVVMDYATKALLQLQILEEEDWQDKIRHMRQSAELNAYRSAKSSYETTVVPALQMKQQLEMRLAEPDVDPVERDMIMQELSNSPLPQEPPQPPGWAGQSADDEMFEPEPIRKVPVHMFWHAVCIEPLVSSLGIGYGRMLSDHNRGANVALSQYTDAATLANAWGIIKSGNITFDGDIKFRPGSVTTAKNVSAQDLKAGIMELKPGPANPQLVEVVRMLRDFAESAAQSPDVLSGQSGKSGETYRGIATRVEQATKQLGVFAGKFTEGLAQVLRNNARLNSMFMPDEEIVYVNNHKQGTDAGEELTVGRRLYERDYRVVIAADLRFASQAQRISEADEIVQMPAAVPTMQQAFAFQYFAIVKALKARGMDDMVQHLGPPPPPPQTAFGIPAPVLMGMPPAPPPGAGPDGAPMPDSGGGGNAPAVPEGGPVDQGQPEPVQGVGGPMMPPQ